MFLNSKEAHVAYETKRFVPRLRNTNTTNRKIQEKKKDRARLVRLTNPQAP